MSDKVTFETLEHQSAGPYIKSVDGYVLMVTGLNSETTEDELYDAFSDCGKVKNLSLILDRKTGYAKGYALVEFESKNEAV
jgi:RNA-binding protein 8A